MKEEITVNHDPYPWVADLLNGRGRFSAKGMGLGNDSFEPRPQFETDDPKPWRYINNPDIRYAYRDDAPVPSKAVFEPRADSGKVVSS
jgi:hypothetical protein